jgi:aryl-alcohol dehydrogenase-like predicted oxidoreductase
MLCHRHNKLRPGSSEQRRPGVRVKVLSRKLRDEVLVTEHVLLAIDLAMVLAQGPDVVPIPGTKRITYLEENVASDAVELTAEDLAALDAALPVGAAAGERYADMGTIDR